MRVRAILAPLCALLDFMNDYEHRQIGRAVLVVAGAVWLLMLAATVRHGGPEMLAWSTALLALTAAIFGSLTVRVDANSLRWRFGWLGWPGGAVELDDIIGLMPVRLRWWHGAGIRFSLQGMLYSVGGQRGVGIARRSGKPIRISSDDADHLLEVLVARTGVAPAPLTPWRRES